VEVTYKLPLVKWAVIVEETGLPTADALDILSKELRLSFLSYPLCCERIEKARHFLFDELVVHYREWGYDSLARAVAAYINRFHSSQKTKDDVMNCVMDALGRKGACDDRDGGKV
jgi:hypothetical protein